MRVLLRINDPLVKDEGMKNLILSIIVLGAVLPAYAHRGGDDSEKKPPLAGKDKYSSPFSPESSDKSDKSDKKDEDGSKSGDDSKNKDKDHPDDSGPKGGGKPSSVPEPVSLGLFVLGGLMLTRRRK